MGIYITNYYEYITIFIEDIIKYLIGPDCIAKLSLFLNKIIDNFRNNIFRSYFYIGIIK